VTREEPAVDPHADARRVVVERYASRDAGGAVVICHQATTCGKYKPGFPDEAAAESAAAALTPLVDYPLTCHECPNGDHWHLTTEWDGRPRPFSRYDRVVAALLAAPDGVMTFSEVIHAGQWLGKWAGGHARRVVESLERGGYVLRVDQGVTVTDWDGLRSAHLRKHPNGDHAGDQVGAGE
jgi:hypothetical protein